MTPTRRAAEQEGFGATSIGEAQADAPALDDEMIDDGAGDSITPEEVVRGFFLTVFNAGQLDSIEEFIAPDHMNHDPTAPDVPPGPHCGEIMGIAPSGRRVEVVGLEMNRIARGRIAESWSVSDVEGLKRQLSEPEAG